MGLRDGLARMIAGGPRERKASRASQAVLSIGPFQAHWMGQNLEAYAREGYGGNPYVYACIRQISMAVAGLPWEAFTDSTKKHTIDQHPLLDLLKRPNPRQAGGQFFEALVGYLMLDGNVYLERVGGQGSLTGSLKTPPDELYVLRPDRMRIVPGDALNPVAGYVYTLGGYKVPYPEPLVRHFKLFHPTDDWYGFSPMTAASRAVSQGNAAKEWNVSLLQRGAQPTGALVAPNSVDPESYMRLKDLIEEQYSGFMNAGRPIILEGGLDWKAMGMSPLDMSWIEGQKLSAREIAMVYNIAPELIGDPEAKTYANYQEARKALYQENILPLMDWIRDELNAWLSPLYGDVFIDYDRDEIEALQEDRNAIYERNNAAYVAGWLAMGEAQKAAGVDVDPYYGKYYKWQLPVSAAPGADPGPWSTPKKPEPLPAPTVAVPPELGGFPLATVKPLSGQSGQPNENQKQLPAAGGSGVQQPPAKGQQPPAEQKALAAFQVQRLTLSRKARKMNPSEMAGHLDQVEAQRRAWTEKLIPAVRRQLEPFAAAPVDARAQLIADSAPQWTDFFTQLASIVGTAFATHSLTALLARLDAADFDLTDPLYQNLLDHYIASYSAATVPGRVTRMLASLAAVLEKAEARAAAEQDAEERQGLFGTEDLSGEDLDEASIQNDINDVWDSISSENPGGLGSVDKPARDVNTPMLAAAAIDGTALLTDLAAEIAGTEVLAASDIGPMASALAFQQASGITLVKRWAAVGDDKTRETHADADGQEASVEDAFDVGGEQLLFPTDDSLGAGPEETRYCRCAVIFEAAKARSTRERMWAEAARQVVTADAPGPEWEQLLQTQRWEADNVKYR